MPTLDIGKDAARSARPDADEQVEREDTAAVGAGLDALEEHTDTRAPA